ncbi:tetratricopeptide repeat protein [Legionella sp. km772]|uniref:tetratricopeptide repeat protein n=1 Tax=Legionella sp. km772 TaxID=2498111 RepID=UPI000F8F4A74|nr:tetratricopeptide repeat protein [Legionella sp. km772]RUR07727.1 sel1 repeat family protein [Legionella sp. km772]
MDVKKYVVALSLFTLANTAVFATTAEGEEAYNQQHFEKAYMLLSAEAEKGDAKAQFLLGKMYYNAEGVTYSPEKTEKWLLASANQGNADAQVLLAAFYWYQNTPEGFSKAVSWYQKAADQNNPEGQYGLGYMYDTGSGVPQNYETALIWYKKAAALGNSNAALAIGYDYDMGIGVEKNKTEAVKWYDKAASLGNVSAQYNLGLMYEQGDGVTQDLMLRT